MSAKCSLLFFWKCVWILLKCWVQSISETFWAWAFLHGKLFLLLIQSLSCSKPVQTFSWSVTDSSQLSRNWSQLANASPGSPLSPFTGGSGGSEKIPPGVWTQRPHTTWRKTPAWKGSLCSRSAAGNGQACGIGPGGPDQALSPAGQAPLAEGREEPGAIPPFWPSQLQGPLAQAAAPVCCPARSHPLPGALLTWGPGLWGHSAPPLARAVGSSPGHAHTHLCAPYVPAPTSRMLRPRRARQGQSVALGTFSLQLCHKAQTQRSPRCTEGPEDRRSQAPHNEAPQNQACPICNLFFTRISPPVNLDFKLDCKHLERSRGHTSTHTATSRLKYSPGGGT